ncbi:MAG: neutral/alkaline non-lysosomal ceramidase N-terminal domain-containing protein [Clostridia bacterium]|nr:neutral/alkaline non-lysosomal ceramidase N-terminal domain-containing protein [Clostridia bacterium]
MKRFLALLLALVMILPLAACSSSLATLTEEGEETGKETKEPAKNDETEEKGEIVYPDTFSIGFGSEEMNPPDMNDVLLGMGDKAKGVKEDILATCVAIHDGETTALLFHMDMKETADVIFAACTKQLTEKFGIPEENIIMSSTHTHAAPHTTVQNVGNVRWRQKVTKSVVAAAEEALRDLASAEIFVSTGDTTGLNFSRRYKLTDGTSMMHPTDLSIVKGYETEADHEMRIIRFERKDKKDVILANWQTHYGAGGNLITSDFVHHIRKNVEKDMDSYFAYFNGGSGNLSLNTFIEDRTYPTYVEAGKELAKIIQESVKGETKVESGAVRTMHSDLDGQVKQDTEERKQQAKEISAADGAVQKTLADKYGFDKNYYSHEASSTNTRARMEAITKIPLTVITFGDVAFASFPFEMFDTSCKELRDASPYKMTFGCAYANGHLGYMPPDEIFPNGGYEVVKSFFVPGTAENVVAENLRMLNECKNQG